MKSHNLLSIVIPSYNCALWLQRAVTSTLTFAPGDVEVIIVDDGSTDDTPTLCRLLQQQHPNVRVIRQTNGGLSAARNTGIDAANGEFIVLLDADDELIPFDPTQLHAFGGDMLRIGVEEVGIEGDVLHWAESEGGTTGPAFLQSRLLAKNLYVPSWAYVYRRSFLNHQGLRFTPGLIHEDMLFTVQALMKAGHVQATPAMLYRYFRRAGSITLQHSMAATLRRVDSLAKIARALIDLANRNSDVDLWLWARHVTEYAWSFAQASGSRRVGWQVLQVEWMLFSGYRLWGQYRHKHEERWRLRKRAMQVLRAWK